jgi:hypothetical protein
VDVPSRGEFPDISGIQIHERRDIGHWPNNPCPVIDKDRIEYQNWISDGAMKALKAEEWETFNKLFAPGSTVRRERYFGLTTDPDKSWIVF